MHLASSGGYLGPTSSDHGLPGAGPGQGFRSRDGRGGWEAGGTGAPTPQPPPPEEPGDPPAQQHPVATESSRGSVTGTRLLSGSHRLHPLPPAVCAFNNPKSFGTWILFRLRSTTTTPFNPLETRSTSCVMPGFFQPHPLLTCETPGPPPEAACSSLRPRASSPPPPCLSKSCLPAHSPVHGLPCRHLGVWSFQVGRNRLGFAHPKTQARRPRGSHPYCPPGGDSGPRSKERLGQLAPIGGPGKKRAAPEGTGFQDHSRIKMEIYLCFSSLEKWGLMSLPPGAGTRFSDLLDQQGVVEVTSSF